MSRVLENRAVRLVLGAVVPALLITWWWTASATSTDPFWPPLSDIWSEFLNLWVFEQVPDYVVPSLRNMFAGLFIGVSLGVLIGAHLALSDTLSTYVMPVVDFLRSIPSIALVPIFILAMGLETAMRISVIAFTLGVDVIVITLHAVRSTDSTLLDTAKAFRLSPFTTMWKVRMPAAMPRMFSSGQLILKTAFVVMIGSEMLGSGDGIGAFTKLSADSWMIVNTWTGTILMGLIGYLLFLLYRLLERWVLRWYIGAKRLEA